MSVDLKSLQSAYLKAAALVEVDPVYIPIFERFAHEIAVFETDQDAISRARAIVARYKDAA